MLRLFDIVSEKCLSDRYRQCCSAARQHWTGAYYGVFQLVRRFNLSEADRAIAQEPLNFFVDSSLKVNLEGHPMEECRSPRRSCYAAIPLLTVYQGSMVSFHAGRGLHTV